MSMTISTGTNEVLTDVVRVDVNAFATVELSTGLKMSAGATVVVVVDMNVGLGMIVSSIVNANVSMGVIVRADVSLVKTSKPYLCLAFSVSFLMCAAVAVGAILNFIVRGIVF